MSQWSVGTCPRLQQQGTRQLTGIKEVCWAKKFYFLKKMGRSGDRKQEFFFGVALIEDFLFMLSALVFSKMRFPTILKSATDPSNNSLWRRCNTPKRWRLFLSSFSSPVRVSNKNISWTILIDAQGATKNYQKRFDCYVSGFCLFSLCFFFYYYYLQSIMSLTSLPVD